MRDDVILKVKGVLYELEDLRPHDIADMLAEEGITGHRHNGFICPLARYIQRRVNPPEHIRIEVLADLVCVYDRSFPPGDMRRVTYIAAPKSMEEFVWRFDHGAYPKLEESEEAPERG